MSSELHLQVNHPILHQLFVYSLSFGHHMCSYVSYFLLLFKVELIVTTSRKSNIVVNRDPITRSISFCRHFWALPVVNFEWNCQSINATIYFRNPERISCNLCECWFHMNSCIKQQQWMGFSCFLFDQNYTWELLMVSTLLNQNYL